MHEVPGILQRCKALLLDWLFISAYLSLLAAAASALYFLAWGGIPSMTAGQAQLTAALTSVVPVTAMFSALEGRGRRASFGKQRSGLAVVYTGSPSMGSIIRNVLKFAPWQLGHMSTINGIYHGFDTPLSVICLTLSVLLAGTYLAMAFGRRDGRHLADMIAGSRVVRGS